MAIELKMPALSPTMEEGTLAKWLVKEGDEVSSGDILAEIETDKATMEFEAVDEGVISKILIPEGTGNVKVGTVIATITGEEGESAAGVASTGEEAPAKRTEVETPKAAERPAVTAKVTDPGLPDGTEFESQKIGRAHVCTPVTNAQHICRLLLEK